MNLFRSVLIWLALAVLGALAAQWFLTDPGYVLVRYRGTDYTTTVAAGIGLLLALGFALVLLWALLRLPFRLWRRYRKRRQRARLVDGLLAMLRGEHTRAEQRLRSAAEQPEFAGIAHAFSARIAAARGDAAAFDTHLQALTTTHPNLKVLLEAEQALADARPAAALAALDAAAAQPLPPRGLLLQAQALARSGRSAEAYGLLGSLRKQQVLPAAQLDALQTQWATAALQEAPDTNALADGWDALPAALQTHADVAAAYATRAAALRWDEAATRSLEQALDAQWSEELVALYGTLPISRLEQRRARLEQWLETHPSSPALLLASARVASAQGQASQAETRLHRAIAQGAGAAGWEALGDAALAANDNARARLCYANALRSQRGDVLLELADRDLRQQIADNAAVEERDEHGLPRLRG